MIKVDAIWEKRNLGVNTVEISFEEGDSPEETEFFLKELKADYIVLKIPTHLTNLLPIVHNCGYRYIEDMVYFVSCLPDIKMNSIQRRMHEAVCVEEMTTTDMKNLYDEISEGLFDSDRIYLDDFFNQGIAAKRYINWIKDEKEKGTEFLKYVYKGETIGFFALSEVEKEHYVSFLGGIYKKYRRGGIGSIVKVPEEVKRRGGKKVSTSVSTNNVAQVKSLITNGYIPEGISHTFIKHF